MFLQTNSITNRLPMTHIMSLWDWNHAKSQQWFALQYLSILNSRAFGYILKYVAYSHLVGASGAY